MIGVLVTAAEFIVFCILIYLGYIIYAFVYIPLKIRRKYYKYSNVGMCKERYPFICDLLLVLKNERENKFRFQHYLDMFKENPELDMYFIQVLNTVFFNICSPKALDELNKLIPDKVDRYNHNEVEEVNIVRNSFGLMPSTSNWELRRKIATKTIGINFASKYIPMMILKVDEWSEGVKIGENLNLTVEITKITFKVIMNILFGKDMHKIEKCEYYSPKDGSLSILSFEDAYLRYAKDIVDAKYIGLSKLIPFLATINITEPFKSTERNRKTIYSTLRKFVNMSEDEQSVYKQLLKSNQLSNDEVFYDTVLLLVAGFDATSHSICSTLYYLYKYPRVLEKLKDSLDKGGFSNIDILQDSFLKDMFEQCDYLNYVSKEGLRIDPPAFGSLFYYAKENIEICGTPIDRGRIISINCMIAHYYSTEWHNPTEFLPERFDPESEYFFKPSKNLKEPRSLHSYNPFSVGIRNCVGQILAKLELKVILSRIITTLDFEIDEDQLKNNYAKFNLFSQMDLNGKVISKHVKNKAIYN